MTGRQGRCAGSKWLIVTSIHFLPALCVLGNLSPHSDFKRPPFNFSQGFFFGWSDLCQIIQSMTLEGNCMEEM